MRIINLILMITLLPAANVFSIALGEIELDSYYNEPLNARIPVVHFDREKVEINDIAIANKLAFLSAGIDRPALLEELSFTLKQNTTHGKYIHITSTEVVNELYLDFILDVKSNSQRLSKNITVLVDPRDYNHPEKVFTARKTNAPGHSRKKSHVVESHSMEATVDKGQDSHSMESHSMEATVDKGQDSHSMESHSMESNTNL